MDVLEAALSIGLKSGTGDDSFGTIEQDIVLDTLTELSLSHEEAIDLFVVAVAAVQSARSAGVERIDPTSVFAARRRQLIIQLRYRREMWNVFADLAIDLALRQPEPQRVPVTVGARSDEAS
jgi:hypothetical protein